MKVMFVFPPLWDSNLSIMLIQPLFAGMLRDDGHDVEILDLNSMFGNFVISKEFLPYFANKMSFYKKELRYLKNLSKRSEEEENIILYLTGILEKEVDLYKMLYSFNEKYKNPREYIKNILDRSIKPMNEFYQKVNYVIYQVFKILYCTEQKIPEKYNFFIEWLNEKILHQIRDFNPDMMAFTIYLKNQFEAGVSLSKYIKNRLNPVIVMGGFHIITYSDMLKSNVDNFKYVDVYITGEGYTPLKMIANRESFGEIPNIIYKDNNDVMMREVSSTHNIKNQKFYKPDYSGVDFSSYFLPKPVLPIEGSRGCYHNKCEFCTFMDGGIKYKQKNIDDLVAEIEEYIDKYNIRHFFFTDLVMHPEYARRFANKILERGLKIYYTVFLRLEKEFDKELCNLLVKSGLIIPMFGLESGSDRILRLMNKGTDSKTNSEVLKNFSEAGAKNLVFIMYGIPTETKEDIDKSVKFMVDNYKYISLYRTSNFILYTHSKMAKHPEDFGLKESDFLNKEYKPHKNIAEYTKSLRSYLINLYENKSKLQPSDVSLSLLEYTKEKN